MRLPRHTSFHAAEYLQDDHDEDMDEDGEGSS